jgi:hypothetical protein
MRVPLRNILHANSEGGTMTAVLTAVIGYACGVATMIISDVIWTRVMTRTGETNDVTEEYSTSDRDSK